VRNSIAYALTAMVMAVPLASTVCAAQDSNPPQKLDPAALTSAPTIPQMIVDPDGTLHFGPRTIPPPALNSDAARAAYIKMMVQHAQASAARGGLASAPAAEAPAPSPRGSSKAAALKAYPVVEESSTIGGVGVTIYSPRVIPAKNRNKVVMEFEMDAEAIAVASLGQLKVIKVNYRGGGPSIPGNEDIVAVYRELLKTYKPKSIGMFGASGGCTLAQTTILWLPTLKLPLPGAVGLNTCSGGGNHGDGVAVAGSRAGDRCAGKDAPGKFGIGGVHPGIDDRDMDPATLADVLRKGGIRFHEAVLEVDVRIVVLMCGHGKLRINGVVVQRLHVGPEVFLQAARLRSRPGRHQFRPVRRHHPPAQAADRHLRPRRDPPRRCVLAPRAEVLPLQGGRGGAADGRRPLQSSNLRHR